MAGAEFSAEAKKTGWPQPCCRGGPPERKRGSLASLGLDGLLPGVDAFRALRADAAYGATAATGNRFLAALA